MNKSTAPNTKNLVNPGFNKKTFNNYFERGNAHTMMLKYANTIIICLVLIVVILAFALTQLIPLKTFQIVHVTPVDGGRVLTEKVESNWKPNQANVGYFLNAWAENTFNINYSTWRENIDKSSKIVSGTAFEQLRTHFRKEDFNSAAIMNKTPTYVKTYEKISVNFIKDDVILIRFKTTSIAMPGATPVVKYYALTLNVSFTQPTSMEQALNNPAGIVITSFNLSEESTK